MRFYLDEDLSHKIAEAARRLGLDVTAAHGTGGEGLSDDRQLALATADNRCMVTGNRDDVSDLATQWFIEGRRHAAVLLVPATWSRSDYGRIARALAAYDQIYGDRPTDFLLDFLR